MVGNDKLIFTAEAVAFMRAKLNIDKFSKYFVSKNIIKKYATISRFVPKAKLNKIFEKRVMLSDEIDRFILEYGPQQIIEIACGYSLRGLKMTLKNKNLVYIESDFKQLIDKKDYLLKELAKKENIQLSKNYHLLSLDVVNENIIDKTKKYLNKNKRTLVVAETLVSYLNTNEHDFLMGNVRKVLNYVNEGAYISHENKEMLTGFFGKLLLLYRNILSKTKSHKHFNNANEIEKYFKDQGYKKIKIFESNQTKNFIYLAINKKESK